MKTLVVTEIKKSIDIMDEFVDNDYDYLELQNWYRITDSRDRKYDRYSNEGRLNVSLLVSKDKTSSKSLCDFSPTMTELREMKYRGLFLDFPYAEGSMSSIIRDACKEWKTDTFIPLTTEILLRAQTSYNRMDYGCEWLGGGDWEEKTLYGETTDFFITGIILREPKKLMDQEAYEMLMGLKGQAGCLEKSIYELLAIVKNTNEKVYHKVLKFPLKEGVLIASTETSISVDFNGKIAKFPYPDCFLNGHIISDRFSENITSARTAFAKLETLKKQIALLQEAIETDDFFAMYHILNGTDI